MCVCFLNINFDFIYFRAEIHTRTSGVVDAGGIRHEWDK